VNVLDVGFGEDRAPFIVMELLEGESLAQCIAREKRIAPNKIADIVCSVLDALEVVHARGIVHRDLKPDNVFLVGRDGRAEGVKLLDFGISKVRDFDGMPTLHTHTGVMLGTPQYMSPEQARGMRGIDHRADLYAAGVILYEALTGRLPFEASNYHALLQLILAGTPRPVLELAPDIPPELATLVDTAMARTPEGRFQTAKAMRFALNPFASRVRFTDTGSRVREPASPVDVAQKPRDPISLADTQKAPVAYAELTPRPRETLQTREIEREPLLPLLPRTTPQKKEDDTTRPARFATNTPAEKREVDREPSQPRPSMPLPRQATGPLARPSPTSLTRPTQRATPLPSEEDEAPRATSNANVRGAMMLGAFEHMRSAYGEEALARVRASLTPESRKLLEGVMRPATLTPIAVFEELIDACDKLFGNNLIELPRAMGRTIASRELPSSLRSAMSGSTPGTVVSRLPLAWTALYDVGFISVAPGDSACVLEVRGASIRSQSHALLLTGLVARLVESSGAKDVRAYIVHTRAPTAAVAMHVRFR
jgi:serine/threonine-protein kinase